MKDIITSLKSLKSKNERSPILKEFPGIIFQLDEDGRLLDFYCADDKLLTVPSNRIIGSSLKEFFPPLLAEKTMKHLQEVVKSQGTSVFEYSILLDKSEYFFEAKLIYHGDGIYALIRDVTEQHALSARVDEHNRNIKESEKRFRLLADNLPGAVYLCNNDEDFSMIYLNEKVHEITGYTPEQFIKKEINFPDIYHPEDVHRIYQEVEQRLGEQKAFRLEYRIFHKSGTIRWIEEFGTGVYIEDQLICLEGYLQDITDRKKVEKQIREQNEALAKTNEELDRFVYSASHDLRSPLSSLRGLINLASKASEEELVLFLTKMQSCVVNLEHFITEITYYSQNSRLEVVPSKENLIHLTNECVESLMHMEEANGILFKIDIPKETFWFVDANRLKMILNNLIGNSIKYSDRTKQNRWIRIKSHDEEGELLVTIEDNGVGIPIQYQPKIFNMFYRASEKSSGSGLGLYIVKETVEKMSGRIEFSSVEGEGSSFIVRLPRK